MGGISIWQLLIVLGIVALLFGTKKLRGVGGDIGSAIKGFKKAMSDEEQKSGSSESEGEDPASLQQKEQAEPSESTGKESTGEKSKSRH